MADKGQKNKYETDFDFHEFFFKGISHNDQEITEKDLDNSLAQLKMLDGYSSNTAKIVQKTEGSEGASSITFEQLHNKLFAMQNVGLRKKKGGLGDGYSDAQTIY